MDFVLFVSTVSQLRALLSNPKDRDIEDRMIIEINSLDRW